MFYALVTTWKYNDCGIYYIIGWTENYYIANRYYCERKKIDTDIELMEYNCKDFHSFNRMIRIDGFGFVSKYTSPSDHELVTTKSYDDKLIAIHRKEYNNSFDFYDDVSLRMELISTISELMVPFGELYKYTISVNDIEKAALFIVDIQNKCRLLNRARMQLDMVYIWALLFKNKSMLDIRLTIGNIPYDTIFINTGGD